MKEWFTTLVSDLAELPAIMWMVLAAIVISGIILSLLVRKRAGKPAIIAVSATALTLIVVLLATGLPSIVPETAENGGLSNAAQFLYNPWFITAVFCVLAVSALLFLLRRQQWTARMLATASLCIAASFVLSYITLYRQPYGGSITPASMLPILLFSYLYGPIPGIAAGLIHGIIQLIQGAYVIHPFQFLLDYILPFAALGLCGFFRKSYKQFLLGITVAGLVRLLVHFIAGYVFWYANTPPGQAIWVYSLVYNGTYMIPEIVICLLVASIPQFRKMVESLRSGIVKA